MIKNTYKNLSANIILHDEKLDAFLLRSETRQECWLSPHLFNIILKVLANAITQEKEVKGTLFGKEKIKLIFDHR